MERVKGRIGAEFGTHNADLTNGSTVRVTDAVVVLFVSRVAMLTAREIDFNMVVVGFRQLRTNFTVVAYQMQDLPTAHTCVGVGKDTMTSSLQLQPWTRKYNIIIAAFAYGKYSIGQSWP